MRYLLRALGLGLLLVPMCSTLAHAQSVQIVDGIVVVEDAGTLITSDRQMALPPESAFKLTPNSKNSFDSARTRFEYEQDAGRRIVDRLDSVDWVEVDLNFEFPFGGNSFRRARVSKRGCIAFGPEQGAPVFRFRERDMERQYQVFDAIADATPRLCPLFTTPIHSTPHRFTSVSFNESNGRAWFSWEGTGGDPTSFGDISFQLTLNRSGAVTFAYRRLAGVQYGAIMAVTGREPWWTAERLLMRSTHAVQVPHGELRDFQLHQREDSNVLVAKLRFADQLPRTSPTTASYTLELYSSTRYLGRIVATIGPQGWSQQIGSPSRPEWTSEMRGIAPLGDTLSLAFPLEFFDGSSDGFTVRLNLAGTVARLTDLVRLTIPPRDSSTDFGAGSRDRGVPMFDVYTVPVIASTRLRQFLGARFGNAWDHAFVYPNFDHGDGGYSTGDNPAVDGIGHWDTSRVPASGVTLNSYIPLDVANYRMCDYLLHGFGHRWLYYAQVIENGVKSYVQNPGGIHAGDYVYTAAAFPVSSPREWSTMGGNPWRDEGNGRFSFVPGVAIPPNCGYSWVDLYLMGLAAPSEVPPWFYIRDPQPIPGTIMITGTKVPVTIEQIIAANGPRVPDVQASPKEFTTLFVFLHRAGERITPDQLQRLQAIRDRFGRTFETAVGRRARIRTTAAPTPTASPASIPTENQSLPLFVR